MSTTNFPSSEVPAADGSSDASKSVGGAAAQSTHRGRRYSTDSSAAATLETVTTLAQKSLQEERPTTSSPSVAPAQQATALATAQAASLSPPHSSPPASEHKHWFQVMLDFLLPATLSTSRSAQMPASDASKPASFGFGQKAINFLHALWERMSISIPDGKQSVIDGQLAITPAAQKRVEKLEKTAAGVTGTLSYEELKQKKTQLRKEITQHTAEANTIEAQLREEQQKPGNTLNPSSVAKLQEEVGSLREKAKNKTGEVSGIERSLEVHENLQSLTRLLALKVPNKEFECLNQLHGYERERHGKYLEKKYGNLAERIDVFQANLSDFTNQKTTDPAVIKEMMLHTAMRGFSLEISSKELNDVLVGFVIQFAESNPTEDQKKEFLKRMTEFKRLLDDPKELLKTWLESPDPAGVQRNEYGCAKCLLGSKWKMTKEKYSLLDSPLGKEKLNILADAFVAAGEKGEGIMRFLKDAYSYSDRTMTMTKRQSKNFEALYAAYAQKMQAKGSKTSVPPPEVGSVEMVGMANIKMKDSSLYFSGGLPHYLTIAELKKKIADEVGCDAQGLRIIILCREAGDMETLGKLDKEVGGFQSLNCIHAVMRPPKKKMTPV